MRLWSLVLDSLVPVVAVLLVSLLFPIARGEAAEIAIGALILAILFGNVLADLILMARGKTFGKWLTGEVVLKKEEGKPAGFWGMVLREVVGKTVSSLLFGLGFIWAIFDRDSQAWYDKMAGTVVVKETKAPLGPRPGGPRGTA